MVAPPLSETSYSRAFSCSSRRGLDGARPRGLLTGMIRGGLRERPPQAYLLPVRGRVRRARNDARLLAGLLQGGAGPQPRERVSDPTKRLLAAGVDPGRRRRDPA